MAVWNCTCILCGERDLSFSTKGRRTLLAESPAWEIAAPAKQGSPHHRQLSKAVRELHVAFKIPYVYDFITKLCRQQAEAIQNHVNPNVRNIGQGEAQHRKYKRLKHGGGLACDRSSD
jgi:hypothetical protein